MPRDWSREEVEAIVADYLAMLGAEIEGRPYSKTEHRRRLSRVLNRRTDGSIERKHRNISAVLLEFGIPYVDGYKPLRHYQQLLFDVVAERLRVSPGLVRSLEQDVLMVVQVPTIDDILARLTAPPLPARIADHGTMPTIADAGLKVNYLELEARNRALGQAGEEFVVRYETARLVSIGRDDLAGRVQHVSSTVSDRLGFDVLSFGEDGAERMIEVKTTKYGVLTPFFVTSHELAVSERHADGYSLYRVFDFRKQPRLYFKQGHIGTAFTLSPSEYIARLG